MTALIANMPIRRIKNPPLDAAMPTPVEAVSVVSDTTSPPTLDLPAET
jgi:hypothetical protein